MRILLKALLLFSLLAITTQASAQISLGINFGPPRARHEVRGRAPHSGDLWIAGYYTFNDNDRKYAWQPGRWEAPPAPQQVWSAPRYVRRGDHVDYYKGNWHDNGKNKGQAKQKNQGRGNNGKGPGNHGRN